ncbi:MAG: hypothetical protein Q4G47_07670 [Lachnospiraceae bacterium]|nr:hypothetical protein [Lachnospiraceae bacterium]
MKERLQEMNDLKTQRDNFQKNFSVKAATSSKNEKHPFRKMFLKYVILGFIIGLILYLFIRTARILMFGIVLSSEELKNMYGLDRISAVPYVGKVSFIDRLILRIGGDRFSSMNSDIAFEIAYENISEKLSGINAAGSVALVTDLPEDRAQMVLDRISEHAEGGVKLEVMPHLTHSPKELAKLKSCDAAVIVAEGGYSKLHSVLDLIHALETYRKQVLGSIVIG